jgi:hypothetical protein
MKNLELTENIIGGGWGCFFAGVGCAATVAATVAAGWSPAAVIPGVAAVATCGGAIYACR